VKFNAKRSSQAGNVLKTNIALAPFDAPYVRSVKLTPLGKILLRPPSGQPELPHSASKAL
jgi:hypothetical protein